MGCTSSLEVAKTGSGDAELSEYWAPAFGAIAAAIPSARGKVEASRAIAFWRREIERCIGAAWQPRQLPPRPSAQERTKSEEFAVCRSLSDAYIVKSPLIGGIPGVEVDSFSRFRLQS